MLFDTSPEEPVKAKARARKKVAVPEDTAPTPQNAPSFIGKRPPLKRLGMIDGHYQCADEACGASEMDIIDEYRGQWTLECAYCGTGSVEPALVGHLKPREEEFVFRDGRFAGQTISEAMDHPRGPDYVRWAAGEHPRQAVRDACRTHLDRIASAP